MQINICNFLFHPFHSTHSAELKAFSVVTILALSILTVGLYLPLLGAVHVGEWAWQKLHATDNQKITTVVQSQIPLQTPGSSQGRSSASPQVTKPQEIVTDRFGREEKNFFQSITPENIDEVLNVQEDNWCQSVKKCLFSMRRWVSDEKSYDDEIIARDRIVGYSCCFEMPKGKSWTGTSLEVENGRFKCHENGTRDTYHYFDNLEQFLQYLCKGSFYQGEHFKSDFFILNKKDNSEAVYQNPYK